ncbi:MAG: hypothetical protein ABW007_04065 [Chitinophagaceae bacterium]
MNKIKEIATAWKNVLIKDEEIEALSKQRMEVCNACPKKVVRFGAEICAECGCFLVGKTRANVNGCPLRKWEK